MHPESAQLQQEAMEGHRQEARLRKLDQRRMPLVVLERRRQGLKDWGHKTKYWSRCCKCGSRTCLQQMRHCQT